MSKILLKNADILTGDRENWFLTKKNICISGNIIKFIKDPGQIVDFKPSKTIDCTNKLIIPGLVNAHTHTGMTLFRNYGNDLTLQDWLFNKIFPAEELMNGEEVYWGTVLGIAEMISSGTTSCADMYLFMEEAVRAYAETGMRVNIAPGPFKFVSKPAPHMLDETDWFKSFFRNWNGSCNDRIKVYVQAHSVYILDSEHLKKAAVIASTLGTGIHMHILETEQEREDSFRIHGMDVLDACKSNGLLENPIIAAHCTYLNQKEREMFYEYKVNAVHNPVSNLKLGCGIADIPSMIDCGINVALGTDGPASNNNLDMLEEMKFAALIHKGKVKNPVVTDAKQIFEMATTSGAIALNQGNYLGKIKEGYKADLAIINMRSPHLRPVKEPTADIVYCSNGADVESVIIDGNIVMENRELKTIDIEKAIYMVESSKVVKALV